MSGAYHAEGARQGSMYGYEVVLAPADTETESIGEQYRNVKVITPASGTGKLKLPPAPSCPGVQIDFDVKNTGGGAVQLVASDGSTDVIGDNFTAADDYASVRSNGSNWMVLADKTT